MTGIFEASYITRLYNTYTSNTQRWTLISNYWKEYCKLRIA